MEQIKIDKALYDAMEIDNYTEIEKLLKAGANPLVLYDDRIFGDSPLSEFFCSASSDLEDSYVGRK